MEQKSVLIGMSGGVDSSVAAALLKEQGYHVIGATMRLWTYSDSCNMKHEGCCAESAVEDARRVCDKLGIDFYVMNFKDMFKDKVVDYFVDEYIHGRTPNPCIACNKYLKFDALKKTVSGSRTSGDDRNPAYRMRFKKEKRVTAEHLILVLRAISI